MHNTQGTLRYRKSRRSRLNYGDDDGVDDGVDDGGGDGYDDDDGIYRILSFQRTYVLGTRDLLKNAAPKYLDLLTRPPPPPPKCHNVPLLVNRHTSGSNQVKYLEYWRLDRYSL